MLRMPKPPDPALASAWSRVAHHSEKLREALEALEGLGGACRVAASARWGPEAHDRALGGFLAVQEAIDVELGQLEARRRHYPTRGRRLG